MENAEKVQCINQTNLLRPVNDNKSLRTKSE